MDNRMTTRPTPQLVLGLVVIILGILFTLDNLHLMYVGDYLRYWPVLLLAYGVYRLMEPGHPPNLFPGIIFTFIGGVWLLNTLHFHLAFHQYWPLALVLLGFGIISHAFRHDHEVSADSNSQISAFGFMSGIQRTCRAQNFRGGELTAIMGGCEIDLRQAEMQADEAVISAFSFWGGIEIRVPDHWMVTTEVLPLLGGCEDHTEAHGDGPRKHLIIKGLVVMGGIEVRN